MSYRVNYVSTVFGGADCTMRIFPAGTTLTGASQWFMNNYNVENNATTITTGFPRETSAWSEAMDQTNIVENAAILLRPYQDVTSGNGSIDVYLTYRIIEL